MSKAWESVIQAPLEGRKTKPRGEGITMVIDKGIGLQGVRDLIEMAGDYIDLIKLTFGTSAFYDQNLLRKKNEIITSSRIEVMPGGTFLKLPSGREFWNSI